MKQHCFWFGIVVGVAFTLAVIGIFTVYTGAYNVAAAWRLRRPRAARRPD